MYEPILPLFAALRHENTTQITWLEPFTEEHARRVIDGVKRIQAILTGEAQGTPTSNKKKYVACRLRMHCNR